MAKRVKKIPDYRLNGLEVCAPPVKKLLNEDDPKIVDGSMDYVPEQYQHDNIKGCRLPGWEDLNTLLLAEDLSMSAQHLRQVLTGRTGATMSMANRIARHLGIGLEELVKRINWSQKVDRDRVERKDSRVY